MQPEREMTGLLLQRYHHWLTSTFLDSPMCVGGPRSIVCDDAGEIVGFLGVVPRQVQLGDRIYRGTAGSNFCIKPGRRGPLGLQMARQFLAISSELAFIDELTDNTRVLWDRLGLTAMPQSTRWTLPIRPAQHVLSLIRQKLPGTLATVARPVAAAMDRFAAALPHSPFQYPPVSVVAEDLSPAQLARLLTEFGGKDFLRPVTTDGSTVWLVERARSMKQHGRLYMIGLRDSDGVLVGWYVYYAKPGGTGEVLDLVGTQASSGVVLRHLAKHARDQGVVNLTGRLDPTFLTPLSDLWAVISPRPMVTRWLHVHSRRPEIIEAFWRNKVLLSRLDGEWCQHFE